MCRSRNRVLYQQNAALGTAYSNIGQIDDGGTQTYDALNLSARGNLAGASRQGSITPGRIVLAINTIKIHPPLEFPFRAIAGSGEATATARMCGKYLI